MLNTDFTEYAPFYTTIDCQKTLMGRTRTVCQALLFKDLFLRQNSTTFIALKLIFCNFKLCTIMNKSLTITKTWVEVMNNLKKNTVENINISTTLPHCKI